MAAQVPINQGGSAATLVLVAGKTGNRIRLISLFGSMTVNGTLQFQEQTSNTALTGVMTFTGGSVVSSPGPAEHGEGILETQVAGNGLQIVSGTSGFNGVAVYQYIPG